MQRNSTINHNIMILSTFDNRSCSGQLISILVRTQNMPAYQSQYSENLDRKVPGFLYKDNSTVWKICTDLCYMPHTIWSVWSQQYIYTVCTRTHTHTHTDATTTTTTYPYRPYIIHLWSPTVAIENFYLGKVSGSDLAGRAT